MTVTISRLFDSYAQGTEAVRNLETAGVPHSDISIVSNNSDNWYSENTARTTTGGPAIIDRDRDGVDDRAEAAGTGAGIGATAGGVVGLLTGLGLLAIPGVGPVVAAGWLVATAAGAAVGGTAGGHHWCPDESGHKRGRRIYLCGRCAPRRHVSQRASGRRRPGPIRGCTGPVVREHSRSRRGMAQGRLAELRP